MGHMWPAYVYFELKMNNQSIPLIKKVILHSANLFADATQKIERWTSECNKTLLQRKECIDDHYNATYRNRHIYNRFSNTPWLSQLWKVIQLMNYTKWWLLRSLIMKLALIEVWLHHQLSSFYSQKRFQFWWTPRSFFQNFPLVSL